MNVETFKTAYSASRNGANHFVRNPLYRKFLYSDGVQECAEAGCYWLLDILGTELPGEFTKRGERMCVVKVIAKDGKATIRGEFEDDDPQAYVKRITYTDMPDGEWMFYVTYEGPEFGYRCILPSEY